VKPFDGYLLLTHPQGSTHTEDDRLHAAIPVEDNIIDFTHVIPILAGIGWLSLACNNVSIHSIDTHADEAGSEDVIRSGRI
jgi:hypothetical protein